MALVWLRSGTMRPALCAGFAVALALSGSDPLTALFSGWIGALSSEAAGRLLPPG